MKAEHRHQLHTNVLADRMGRLVQGMKSAPKSTSMLVWVFVVLALATFAVWQYAGSATMRDRSALWASVDAATHNPAGGLSELQLVEARNPGTIPGRSARFQRARWNLQQGLASLAGDERAGALPRLKEARKLYSELVPDCVDVPLLTQEAMMGRATAEESLVGMVEPADVGETSGTESSEQAKEEKPAGSLDKALEYYLDLARKYPDSIFGKKAAERAQELDQTSRSKIEQFYAETNKKPTLKTTPEAQDK
jgi:hypothetical protein